MKTKSIIYSAAVLSVAFVSCQKETVKQDNADCAIVASFDINNIESRADASELSDFYLYIDQPVGTDYYVVLSKGDGSEWKAYQCDVSGIRYRGYGCDKGAMLVFSSSFERVFCFSGQCF